jgi:hypothetical protein
MGDLTALLLDAKAEYRLQMEDVVTPSVVETIGGLWNMSMKEGGSRDGILVFQKYLRGIPGWNASVISNKTKEITYTYPYFEDLIAACIIAQLKIMSSIKLSQDKPTVQLKLPTPETFLHEVYIQTARRLYDNPFMIQGASNLDTVLAPVVSDAIEKTIRKMIPFKDVLIAYLQSGGDQQVAQRALNNRSDDSSGGSFGRDQHNDNDDDDAASDTDSSDSDVHVPVPGRPAAPVVPTPPPAPEYAPEPIDPAGVAMPPLAGDGYREAPAPPAPPPPPPVAMMPTPDEPRPQHHQQQPQLFAQDTTLRQGF